MKQALSLETLALPVTLDTRSACTPTISGTLPSANRIWEITKSTFVCYTEAKTNSSTTEEFPDTGIAGIFECV